MKFISFIASTMLIVLIGQHSIMGAPAPPKKTGGSCLKGYEMVNGQCKPINSMTDSTENLSNQPVTQFTSLKAGGCPKGMKYGKHGICESIQSVTDTEVHSQERADPNSEEIVTMIMEEAKLVTHTPILDGGCAEGWKHGKHGICEPIKPETDTEATSQERADPNSKEIVTMIMDVGKLVTYTPRLVGGCSLGSKHGKNGLCEPIKPETDTEATSQERADPYTGEPVTMMLPEQKLVTDEPQISGRCPEGMEHGEHGICKPIEDSNTTEATDELTTELNENAVGGVDMPQGCPNGTQPDEQGYCQPIQPANSTKLSTDPKHLLNQDGSCPEDYKMIGSQCLYIKPETNSTLYSGDSTADDMTGDMESKNGKNGASDLELVPVLFDNSCPVGTVYSSYGLCQKRTRPSNSNLLMKADGSCPDGFELIDNKCTPKNAQITDQLGFPTTTMKMFKRTPLPQATFDNDKSYEEKNGVGK